MLDPGLRELYQQVILDHNKSPRNFKKLETANRKAEGYNPLCGDKIDIYMNVEGDIVKDISFQGSGCAISKASASLMSTIVKGKTVNQTKILFEKFHDLITGKLNGDAKIEELGKLTVLSGVKEFPVRVKCATLAWHTMLAALQGKDDKITTE